MFIDTCKIYIKAGNGGDGCISFHREKFVPLGGPDGGNGGKGGDVIVRATSAMRTLIDLKVHPHYKAESGKHGQGDNKYGKGAQPLLIHVPKGTMVFNADGGGLVADLITDEQEVIVAHGGRGGRGNARFKSASRRAPRIAERGEPGEEVTLRLELKLLADVGLVGYPNAGKSTLLSRISKANPKIADYPFTTLTPNLGVVRLGEGTSFVVADIPGLIEGAHKGVGLGDAFLRHIERTRLLIHVIDVFGFDNHDAWTNYRSINNELKLYNPGLAKKPQVIVLNKIDLTDADEKIKAFKRHLKKKKIFSISGVTGQGIKELMDAVYQELQTAPETETISAVTMSVDSIGERKLSVNREENVFVVSGKQIEKLVAMTRLEEDEAVRRMQNIFKKMRVDEQLRKEGIKPGDTVRIGKFEFKYEE